MDALLQDLRHTARGLLRQKSLTVAALVTLGLGIGANTAIFSVVYGVLLRPLPYPEAEELVRVSEEHRGANAPISGLLSDLTLLAWEPSMTTLEDLAPWSVATFTVGREDPERLAGSLASPALFSLLGATPAHGRFFREEEAVEGASDVVVLSHRLWMERFGGEPEALGQTLVLDERPHTIVGVAPPGLDFPSSETLLWTPPSPRRTGACGSSPLWAVSPRAPPPSRRPPRGPRPPAACPGRSWRT